MENENESAKEVIIRDEKYYEDLNLRLLGWDTDDDLDILDDVSQYLQPGIDWCGISDRAVSLHNEMFDTDIEEYSPQDDFISGVCAGVFHATVASFARMIGYDPDKLTNVFGEWEGKDCIDRPAMEDNSVELFKKYLDKLNDEYDKEMKEWENEEKEKEESENGK